MIKFFSIGWKPSETREWQDGRTLVHKWSQGAKLPLQPRPYLNFWFWGLWYSSLVFTTTNNQDYKIISWDLWIIFSIKMLWFFPQFSIDYVFIISLLFQTLFLPQLSVTCSSHTHWTTHLFSSFSEHSIHVHSSLPLSVCFFPVQKSLKKWVLLIFSRTKFYFLTPLAESMHPSSMISSVLYSFLGQLSSQCI